MKNQGFVAITTVLVLLVVVVAVATTAALLSIGEAQSSLALYKGEDKLHLVEGCGEDLLSRIRTDQNFSQNTITLPEGSCSIEYTSSDPNWDVTVSSVDPDYKRQVRLVFTRAASGLSLTSWQEITTVSSPTSTPSPTPSNTPTPTPTESITPTPSNTPTPTPTNTPTPTPTNTPTPTPTTPAGDTTPPNAVTNLATSAGTDPRTMVNLSWSAPADNVGVTSYDIRYSMTAITEANWASANQVSGEPVPAAPGTPQSYMVTGLASNKTYYFAIKSSDAASNISAISNVPSRKTSR